MLDALVADHVPPGTVWSRMTDEHLTPMRMTVDEAAKALAGAVAVYWVDGGFPDMFSLPGLDPAPVAFSSRYVEISANLFRLLRLDYDADILTDLAETFFLSLMAEFTLRKGDHSTACYLAARSHITAPGFLLFPSSIDSLEHEPKDENYMAVWFFGLLHEIGHVHARQTDLAELAVSSDLRARIDSALSKSGFPPKLQSILDAWNDADSSLNVALLSEEIAADRFAVIALGQATTAVMRVENRAGVETMPFAQAVLDMFHVLALFNRCAATVDHATFAKAPRTDPLANASYQVRGQLVAELIAWIVAQNGGSETDALDAIHERNEERLQHAQAVESGLARAMRQVLFPWERDGELVARLQNALSEPQGATTWYLDHFIDLANNLGSLHRDVRLLRSLRAGVRVMASDAETYVAIWADFSDSASFPFGVNLGGQYVVFVFLDQHTLFQYFLDESRRGLAAGVELKIAAVMANAEWEVRSTCHRALPADIRARSSVVVEGTPLFDRKFSELAEANLA